MPVVTWSVKQDGQQYDVELNHNIFTGRRIIRVNGTEAARASKFFDVGTSQHAFQVGDKSSRVTIHTVGNGVTYDLYVGKKHLETRKFSQSEILQTMPRWGWVLVSVVGLIAVIRLGGAFNSSGVALTLPLFLVLAALYVGFFIAVWVVSSKTWALWLRVAACLGLAVAFSAVVLAASGV